MENLDTLLDGYIMLLLCVEFTFVTHPVVYKTKLWHLLFLFSKVSIAVFNICIVTHINPYFIVLINMMAKMSSYLYGVVIKLNTTQPRIV